MKVFTLREHDNHFGTCYRKPKGYIYVHPQPAVDIQFGYVREATKAEIEAEARKSDTGQGNAAEAQPGK